MDMKNKENDLTNWFFTRVPSPFDGGKNIFSINGVATTGFPHAKNEVKQLFHTIYQN